MTITTFIVVLLIASLVAIASRRLTFPYSVGLVIAGIAIAVFPTGVEIPLTRDLIFDILLPPLVFEAALQLQWKPFRRDLPVTTALAFPGVAVATMVVAVGMHALLGWSWIAALLFGVLIAATDPVAVIATFKELKVEERTSYLVESESLLNDGAAAVGFTALVALAGSDAQSATATAIAASLVWSIGGGILAGLSVAAVLLIIAGRTKDHLVEITFTTIIAYGSFVLAERFHASGVLAALTAGLTVGNFGWKRAISERNQGHVLAFWEYAAFLANSVIFILIGEQEAHEGHRLLTTTALCAVALTLLGRAAAVYPIAALFSRSRIAVSFRQQHVLLWGGLRGALALALVLAIPASVPERPEITAAAFAVVAFSVFVQALSMPRVVRYLGLTRNQFDQNA